MRSALWSFVLFVGLLLMAAGGGLWWLHREAELEAPRAFGELSLPSPAGSETPAIDEGLPEMGTGESDEPAPFEWPEGVIRGEFVMSFATRGDLEQFLRDARRAGLTDLEAIPALGLVRVRTGNDEEARLALRLAGVAGVDLNPFVASPEVPPLEGFAGRYVAFGDQALAWMGVPEDHSSWGAGMRIAVLDTGVGEHPSLAGASITHLSMLGEGVDVGTHGTAVASLLVGQGEVRGIVPGADLLSIQVLDATGFGSAFDLARGIMAAVDHGAHVINMSLGTPTDSAFLREAVLYAQQRGVVIVAASGNDGAGRSLYPAGYEGVLSVGSVDARGQHVWFSNRDADLSLVAPGYGLMVAGPGGSVVLMDGTSFGAPLVAGSAAYLLQSEAPARVPEILTLNANDGGAEGHDGIYGFGTIDLQRVRWANQPGIYDIAVAGHYLDTSGRVPQLQITVQNQGTATVGGIVLEVAINDEGHRVSIGTLRKNEVRSAAFPLSGILIGVEDFRVVSAVSAPGITDVRPGNNFSEVRLRLSR